MKIIASGQKTVVLTPHASILAFSKVSAVMQVLLASCFIGLCAQIKISLFFTPVPLTGQALGVMLIGVLLGSKRGALAALLYLVEGSLGLPVWAGGKAGFLHIFGPTGGYLLAYPLQTYLIGLWLQDKPVFSEAKVASVLFLSCMVQLMLGSLWLSFFVGMKNMLLMGFYPFIVGDGIKALFITWYLRFRKRKESQ